MKKALIYFLLSVSVVSLTSFGLSDNPRVKEKQFAQSKSSQVDNLNVDQSASLVIEPKEEEDKIEKSKKEINVINRFFSFIFQIAQNLIIKIINSFL